MGNALSHRLRAALKKPFAALLCHVLKGRGFFFKPSKLGFLFRNLRLQSRFFKELLVLRGKLDFFGIGFKRVQFAFRVLPVSQRRPGPSGRISAGDYP